MQVSGTVFLKLLAMVVALCVLSGCETLSYYSQSVGGQLEVLNKRRPIVEVLEDEAVDAQVRVRLASILEMRKFAVSELGLPDNRSYTDYTDLKRKHVVWNVFAAPELSVKPLRWCFPVVGCVVYRGYFDEQDAQNYANGLNADGFDTMVAGIDAYSTLGWFADPVLNTFLDYSEENLAGLIFHELTHQRIYIKDDSMFNESLATAVQIEGIRRWLTKNGKPADGTGVMDGLARRDDVSSLLISTREQLETIYESKLSDADKRVAKREAFTEMKVNYEGLKRKWDGYSGYDRFFARQFNNASLISASTYKSRVPAFTALMKRSNGDMDEFWRSAKALSELSPQERDQSLDELAASTQ